MISVDFARYSSVRIGPKINVEILKNTSFKEDVFMVGAANNLLISPSPKQALAMLGDEFDYIKVIKEGALVELEVGAKTSASKLFRFAKDKDLGGLEFLQALPGQIAGLLRMNAGLKQYEISSVLSGILVASKEEELAIWRDDFVAKYRRLELDGIYFAARIELRRGFCQETQKSCEKLRSNQPKAASFGSIFKNPKDDFAGRLIEVVGLKGARRNDAMISDKHANFLINKGKATYADAIFLIDEARNRVKKEFGIDLELEVILV